VALNSLYQQAVAEGISVFVATGDTGASGCAYEGYRTTYGIGVNAWATTQYNVAVGGTDFSDTYSQANAQYWTSSNGANWASAKSYVPEFAWNDTCAGSDLAQFASGSPASYGKTGFCNTKTGRGFLRLGGGEGGPSGCYSGAPTAEGVVGGTCRGYAKPTWQQGTLGNPSDGVRDVPDVSMFAADGLWGHYYLLCFSDTRNKGGPCTSNPGNWPPGGGGTSYAAPIAAGIQALVNQKMGAKQGNPNPVYYKLAAMQFGSSANASCNASLGASIGASCVFNDVTDGNNAQPCAETVDCYLPSGILGVMSVSDKTFSVAYGANAGWDFTSGIGTVNANNLVSNWARAAP